MFDTVYGEEARAHVYFGTWLKRCFLLISVKPTERQHLIVCITFHVSLFQRRLYRKLPDISQDLHSCPKMHSYSFAPADQQTDSAVLVAVKLSSITTHFFTKA
jgi:hypothetical protein